METLRKLKIGTVILIAAFLVPGSLVCQDIVAQRDTVEMDIETFKEYLGLKNEEGDIVSKKQPISNVKDVNRLLKKMVTPTGKGLFGNEKIEQWLKSNDDDGDGEEDDYDIKNKAIIFLQHSLDLEAFFSDDAKQKKLQENLCTFFDRNDTTKIKLAITTYESLRDINYGKLEVINDALKKSSTSGQRIEEADDGGGDSQENAEPGSQGGDADQKAKELLAAKKEEIKKSIEKLKKSNAELDRKIKSLSSKKELLEIALSSPDLSESNKEKFTKDLKATNQAIADAGAAKRKNKQQIGKYNNDLKELEREVSQTEEDKANLLAEQKRDKHELIQQNANLDLLIEAEQNKLAEAKENLKAYQESYDKTFGVFKENDEVNEFLLSKEGKKWSEYLFDEKDILIVVLGGETDIASLEIKIENQTSRFEETWSQVVQVATAAGYVEEVESTAELASACGELKKPKPSKLKMYFHLLERSKIKPPSKLTLSHESFKEDFEYQIHERVFAQFKIGISASTVDRKDFILDTTNDTFEIQPDSTQSEEWKGNAMVFLEFYPWGGLDYDRLTPIWKDPIEQWYRRLTPSIGVRLSTDPLETIFIGANLLITKSTSLNAGFAYQSTPRDLAPVQVDPEAAVDLLINNADRIYERKFYIGISFTPLAFGKAVGLVEN